MPFRLALRAAHHHHLPSRRKRVHQKRSGNRLFPRSADTSTQSPLPSPPLPCSRFNIPSALAQLAASTAPAGDTRAHASGRTREGTGSRDNLCPSQSTW